MASEHPVPDINASTASLVSAAESSEDSAKDPTSKALPPPRPLPRARNAQVAVPVVAPPPPRPAPPPQPTIFESLTSGVFSLTSSVLSTFIPGGGDGGANAAGNQDEDDDAGYLDNYNQEDGDREDFVYSYNESAPYPSEPGSYDDDNNDNIDNSSQGGTRGSIDDISSSDPEKLASLRSGSSRQRLNAWPIDRNFVAVSDALRQSSGRWITLNLFRKRKAQIRALIRENKPVAPLQGNEAVCLLRAARGALEHVLSRGDSLRLRRAKVMDYGSTGISGKRIHDNAADALLEAEAVIAAVNERPPTDEHHIVITMSHFFQTLAPDVVRFVQTLAVVHDSKSGARAIGYSAPILVTDRFNIDDEYAEWIDQGTDGLFHPARLMGSAVAAAAADLYRRSKV